MLSLEVPLILFLLLLASTASAQLLGRDQKTLTLTGSHHQRIVVPDHMVVVLHDQDVKIDTLIMDKKSALKLEHSSTRLTVGHAFIGKKCLIDGRGEAGITAGSRGTDGKSLDLTIHFHKLGRLTVSTSGGQGTIGYPGRPGTPGGSGAASNGGQGGPGGKGGAGGDGGNLTVHYRGLGFTPVLGRAKRNSLVLNNRGGSGGGGGHGGPGGPGGMPTVTYYVGARGETVREVNGRRGATGGRGNTGEAGDKGKDGVLVVEEMR